MKILIADDHALVREGLAHTLSAAFEDVLIEEAQDFAETIARLDASRDTDLVLLDLRMPGGDGLGLVEDLCDRFPGTAVVVVSASEDPSVIRTVVDRGASGFIPKSSGRDVVLQAIRLVLAGGLYLPAQIMTSASGPATSAEPNGSDPDNRLSALTDRQRQVLALLRRGLSNKEIARDLGLSPNTVKIHVKAVLRALKVTNRTQAATAAAASTDS